MNLELLQLQSKYEEMFNYNVVEKVLYLYPENWFDLEDETRIKILKIALEKKDKIINAYSGAEITEEVR